MECPICTMRGGDSVERSEPPEECCTRQEGNGGGINRKTEGERPYIEWTNLFSISIVSRPLSESDPLAVLILLLGLDGGELVLPSLLKRNYV